MLLPVAVAMLPDVFNWYKYTLSMQSRNVLEEFIDNRLRHAIMGIEAFR
jgi:hypothetical protein